MQDELYHHGILGMHWGSRHGPPYPLHESQKTAKERANSKPNYAKELKKSVRKFKRDATKTVEKVKKAANGNRPDYSVKKRRSSELTDEELAKAIRRMEQEDKYNNLYNARHPQKLTFAQKVTKEAKKSVNNKDSLIRKMIVEPTMKSWMDHLLKSVNGDNGSSNKNNNGNDDGAKALAAAIDNMSKSQSESTKALAEALKAVTQSGSTPMSNVNNSEATRRGYSTIYDMGVLDEFDFDRVR